MHIVLATPLVPPEIGGPATYTKKLAEQWSKLHELTIVAFASTSERIPGVTFLTVSKRRPLPIRLVKYFFVLYKAAKHADIIYAQNAVAAGLPAVLVGLLRGIPVVIKFVGDEAWERATQRRETTKRLEDYLAHPEGSLYVRLFGLIQGWTLRHASMVTTPSAYLRDAIVRAYRVPSEHTMVNYNAAEETDALPFTATRNPNQIVTTARLVAWKGIDGILRAVALLIDRFPEIRLVIAGDGPEEARYRALASELGLEKHVEFLGRVSRAETWHLRMASAVYVLNSTYEGLPHTVLTSFAARIPTIATNIPGTNEAVYDGETGLLVEVGDVHALAEAIARLLTDTTLQKRLVEGGSKLLESKFSWKMHLENLETTFARLAKKQATH